MKIETAKDLEVYQIAYHLAMRIFELSKRFPPEERWALTGQIRRSSRSSEEVVVGIRSKRGANNRVQRVRVA